MLLPVVRCLIVLLSWVAAVGVCGLCGWVLAWLSVVWVLLLGVGFVILVGRLLCCNSCFGLIFAY